MKLQGVTPNAALGDGGSSTGNSIVSVSVSNGRTQWLCTGKHPARGDGKTLHEHVLAPLPGLSKTFTNPYSLWAQSLRSNYMSELWKFTALYKSPKKKCNPLFIRCLYDLCPFSTHSFTMGRLACVAGVPGFTRERMKVRKVEPERKENTQESGSRLEAKVAWRGWWQWRQPPRF